ncbi:MAG: hypothetical protein H7196_04055 [candidate division SR1 bacterium]|nr:hypothetical protein [candidate division SR1 bacterium]
MKTIKILLMGITGDLAKRKILPAIAQFAEKNSHLMKTELIGYSRSEADDNEIQNLLNQSNKNNKHKLSKIEYIQGQYDDANILDEIFSKLLNNERLIIYLAIPPSVFVSFLEKACPLSHANIDIIIEKPFGQNLEEAENIINKTKICTLTRRIHFFDHYAFKTSSDLSKQIISDIMPRIQTLKKVEIKALESVDIKGRSGYFDQTGTLKDMFQHIITIYRLAENYFKLPLIQSSKITIENLLVGQYDSYKIDAEQDKSNTDTYFNLLLKGPDNLEILAESGKSLGIKSTSILLLFNDNSKIIWNFDPQKQICKTVNGQKMISFNLNNDNVLDHTRLFDSVINDDFSKFISHDQIIETWKMYNLINDYKNDNEIKTIIYKAGVYPINEL